MQTRSKTERGRATGPFNETEVKRYSRQFLLPEIGPKGQESLKNSRVLIVGAGGIGSPAAYYLAAAGVGRIGIADPDQVEISNLNRQILHSNEGVGEAKAESAFKTLSKLNPDIEVLPIKNRINDENAENLLSPWDLVVDATDNFESKFLLNDRCVRLGKPLIHAGVTGWKGQVLTIFPGKTPCLRCIMDEPPIAESALTCVEAGILGSVAGIVGSIQATEAVKVLVGQGKSLTGRLLTVDGLNMRFRELKVNRSPNCPVCK